VLSTLYDMLTTRAFVPPLAPIFQQAVLDMRRIQTETAGGNILVSRDHPYLADGGGEESKHLLDVYMPNTTERQSLPLVVHFHGGGWVRGSRNDEFRGSPSVCRAFSAAGYVAMAPSYRLGSCPDYIEDARDAVLWAVRNAARFGADPDRLYISGHSAGGNIASLLSIGGWLAPPVLPRGSIKGCISISGVYTLLKPLGGTAQRTKNKMFDRMCGNRGSNEQLFTVAVSFIRRHTHKHTRAHRSNNEPPV
jgi:carboxylesterase type B